MSKYVFSNSLHMRTRSVINTQGVVRSPFPALFPSPVNSTETRPVHLEELDYLIQFAYVHGNWAQ